MQTPLSLRTYNSVGSTGITQAAGTASSLTKILTYQVPPHSTVRLGPNTVIQLKDRGATETADVSRVQIWAQNFRGSKRALIAEESYLMAKLNQDKALQWHPFKAPVTLTEYAQLEIWINSDQTVATATTEFILSGGTIDE